MACGLKGIFINRSFSLPRTLKMKHMKWLTLPLLATSVSLAASSPSHAQGNKQVYSAYFFPTGDSLDGDAWVESSSKTDDTTVVITLKPDIPALLCTATPRVPTVGSLHPFVNIAGVGDTFVRVNAWEWDPATGARSPIPFNVICVERRDSKRNNR